MNAPAPDGSPEARMLARAMVVVHSLRPGKYRIHAGKVPVPAPEKSPVRFWLVLSELCAPDCAHDCEGEHRVPFEAIKGPTWTSVSARFRRAFEAACEEGRA